MSIGTRHWAIAEGYIPADNAHEDRRYVSHETACLLNTNDRVAHVEITLYFSDREPVGPYRLEVPPRRTHHVRFNDLTTPAPIPLETDYACTIVSDVPIVVQHTRLDSRRPELALMTTVAFAESEH